jgi:glycosyltransferase involved in cell wall biosynthesis
MVKKIIIAGNGSIVRSRNNEYFANKDVSDLALPLIEKGYDIIYVANGNAKKADKPKGFNLTACGVKSIMLTGGWRNPLRYLKILKLIFFLFSTDYAYIYYPAGVSGLLSFCCRVMRIKYGVYVRGYSGYENGENNFHLIKREHDDVHILKNASFLVTVSPKLKSDLKIFNARVNIIRPMIDWSLKNVLIKPVSFYYTDSYNLLFVGALTARKGIYDLFKIAEYLDQKLFRYKLHLVGTSSLISDFFDMQSNGDLSKNIEFHGEISDLLSLSKIYEESHAFILPTRREGFPRVLYEAMIKSVPIFTTMVSGIPGTMIDCYNCIEIPVGKTDLQASIIYDNLGKAKMLRDIAEGGVKTVRDVLTGRSPHHEVLQKCLESL